MPPGPWVRKTGGCHQKRAVHRAAFNRELLAKRQKKLAAGLVPELEPAVADDDHPPLPVFYDNAQPASAPSSPLPSPPSSPPPHQAAVDISSPEAAQALDQMKVSIHMPVACVTDTIVHMYNTG
jgi:hypothetical protein